MEPCNQTRTMDEAGIPELIRRAPATVRRVEDASEVLITEPCEGDVVGAPITQVVAMMVETTMDAVTETLTAMTTLEGKTRVNRVPAVLLQPDTVAKRRTTIITKGPKK